MMNGPLSGFRSLDPGRVTMNNGGSETKIPGSSLTVTDESGDFSTVIDNRTDIDDPDLNTRDDGTYDVLLKDLRDKIGNFSDGDTA